MNSIDYSTLTPLHHDGTEIPYSPVVKNLGFLIDENLTLKPHVMNVISKTNRSLYQLYRFRNITTRELRLKLINSLVLSKLDYCFVATMGTSSELDVRLQRVMNRCVRYIIGIPKHFRISLNWLFLNDRRLYYALSLLFSILQTNKPHYLKILFSENDPFRRLRTNQRLKSLSIPFVRTDQLKFSFVVQTSRTWNSLDEQTVLVDSLEIFKSRIFKYLFNNEKID